MGSSVTDHKLDTLAALADTIADRKAASGNTSYTARLLNEGIEKCAKKLGEEAVETALAAVSGNRGNLKCEAADLIYHLLVVLESAGVKLADVMSELERRRGTGGLDEKASRSGN
jgi:phosphoribosyl-ATP pyrophosphohydrolase